jgi:hypothetical protein
LPFCVSLHPPRRKSLLPTCDVAALADHGARTLQSANRLDLSLTRCTRMALGDLLMTQDGPRRCRGRVGSRRKASLRAARNCADGRSTHGMLGRSHLKELNAVSVRRDPEVAAVCNDLKDIDHSPLHTIGSWRDCRDDAGVREVRRRCWPRRGQRPRRDPIGRAPSCR